MAEKVELPKIATSEYTTTSRLIHSGPCIVKCIHVWTPEGGGGCNVYDGYNTSGTLKAHVQPLANSSYTWRPGEGTDFDQGLYLELSGAGNKVTVTYIPESRKAFI